MRTAMEIALERALDRQQSHREEHHRQMAALAGHLRAILATIAPQLDLPEDDDVLNAQFRLINPPASGPAEFHTAQVHGPEWVLVHDAPHASGQTQRSRLGSFRARSTSPLHVASMWERSLTSPR